MSATVFVVDDNTLTRTLLCDSVRSTGCEPVPFASAREALAAVPDHMPAVCFVDQTMPGMTGAEFIRALRGSPDQRIRSLPVVGVSGGRENELLEAGATSCLRKPCSDATIAATLNALLAAAPATAAAPPADGGTPLAEFRALHERARSGALAGTELALYRAMRTELAQTFLAMQQVSLPPRSRARRALRVAVQFRVDLDAGGQPVHTHTIDLGQGGFSALCPDAPRVGAKLGFRLWLSDREPLEGLVRVANTLPAADSGHRVGFAFSACSAEQLERVELRVFDTVVAQLGVSNGSKGR